MLSLIKKAIPTSLKIQIRRVIDQIGLNRKIRAGAKSGIGFAKPNYLFKGAFFLPQDTIVDVGCGFDADFSVYMIKKFGVKTIGIDPTLKHKSSLAKISIESGGKFIHKEWAVSATDGKISFNESENNVSGSILGEHKNIKNGGVKKYEVESISLLNLPARLNLEKIKYIKLDLEGAEYELIEKIKKEDLEKYEQIFIEFHHHCVPRYSKEDTLRMARKIESFGFNSFSLDKHNFLFYR